MGKKSPCLSCKNKNVYDPLTKCFVCNFSGIECKNFEMYEPNSQTNADKIRSMTDEELAKKISGIESFALTCGGGWPPEKWLDWLRQEANDKPV